MNIRHIGRGLTAVGAIVALLLATALATVASSQHDHGTPEEHHDHGDMAATPGDQGDIASTGTGIVYLTISNDGDDADTLLSASTDRAQMVELHQTQVTDNVGVMSPHDGPLEIPAGESVSFEPGGLHIMLVGLNDDIRAGDTFDLVLTFDVAGEVTIPVTAVLDAEDAEGDPVEAGDLTIESVWSRPAPRIDGAIGTPVATPTP